MRFLKENSYDVVKLFINQIGIAIFSMALYSAVSIAWPGDGGMSSWAQVIISVFAILFYLVLIYTAMWEIGAKDKIKVDGGRMKQFNLKGILMGLLANVPNFLLCGLAALFMGIYLINGVEWLKGVFAILNLIFGFIESMYLGVVINIFPIAEGATAHAADIVYFNRTLAYLIMPMLTVGVTGLGYWLGFKEFRVFSLANRNKNN